MAQVRIPGDKSEHGVGVNYEVKASGSQRYGKQMKLEKWIPIPKHIVADQLTKHFNLPRESQSSLGRWCSKLDL